MGTEKNPPMQGFVCAIDLGEFLREESLPTVASSRVRRQAYLAMHLGAEVGRTRQKLFLILHVHYTIVTPQSKRTPDKKPGVHESLGSLLVVVTRRSPVAAQQSEFN